MSVSVVAPVARAMCSPPSLVSVVAIAGPSASATVPQSTQVASRVTVTSKLTRSRPSFASQRSSLTV